MRAFLVPVADRPECATALKTAFDLAQRLGASVHGCHIRPHSDSKVALPSDLNQIVDTDEAWSKMTRGKASNKQQRAAQALFEQVADHFGYELGKKPTTSPRALWAERVGAPDKLLAIHGPVSDLTVVSRPSTKKSRLARHFMMSAVLYTSRPVLIVPPKQSKTVGRHVAIGWNNSNEAAVSVAAAMPVLQNAEKVTILRGGTPDGVGPAAKQLTAYLAHYGVKTRQVSCDRQMEAGQALAKAFRDCGADLMLMGAYSTSRFRQQIFGGVTEHMLHKASIPVLLLHR